MANDLVVQLLLKTGTFSSDLKTAKGQVQNFQKGCQTAGKSVSEFSRALGINLGSLAKFSGYAGAAAGAGKIMKDAFKANTDAMDSFNREAEVLKSTYRSVISQIFNKSSFKLDFSGIAEQAREFYNAMDTAKIATSAINTQLIMMNTEYDSLYSVAMNVSLAEVDRLEALNEATKVLERQIKLKRQLAQFDKVLAKETMENDLTGSGIVKSWLESPEGQKMLADMLQFDESTGGYVFDTYLKSINTMDANTGPFGHKGVWEREMDKLKSSVGAQQVEQAAKKLKMTTDDYLKMLKKRQDKATEIINSFKYRLAEALHNIRGSDKGLEDISKYVLLYLNNQGVEQVEAEKKNTEALIARLRKRITGKGGEGDEFKYLEESKAHWENIEKVERKYVEGLIVGTEKWNEHNAKLEEALQKIKEIDAHMQAMASRKNWITLPEVDNSGISKEATTNEGKPNLAGVERPKELYTEVELQEKINKLLEKRKTLKEGSKELAENNKALAEYKTRLDALQNYGIDKVLNIKNDTLSSIQSLTSGLHTLSDAFSKLIGDTAGTKNAFSKFLDIVQVGINVFQAMASIIQTVNSLQQIEANTATATAATEIAAEEAKALAKKKSTVQAEEAAEANMKEAVSGAAASQASIPGVGPLLAVAAVAAVLAAIVSAMTSIKSSSSKFANGGIVGGNSFTGDRVTANVNSGEMVLTRAQQANLFRLANGVGTTGGNQVEFHISGTDLVGVLNNNNRKNRLVR